MTFITSLRKSESFAKFQRKELKNFKEPGRQRSYQSRIFALISTIAG